jgi:hypothetical protein
VQKKQEEKQADIENDEKCDSDTNETIEFSLTLQDGENHPIFIRKDGMVNATMLSKAGGRRFNDYIKSQTTTAFISLTKRNPK